MLLVSLRLMLSQPNSWLRTPGSSLNFGRGFDGTGIDLNSRTHAGRKRHTLDVLALGRRRLCPNHAGDHSGSVLDELVGFKADFAHRHVNQGSLVGSKLNLTGFDLFDRRC